MSGSSFCGKKDVYERYLRRADLANQSSEENATRNVHFGCIVLCSLFEQLQYILAWAIELLILSKAMREPARGISEVEHPRLSVNNTNRRIWVAIGIIFYTVTQNSKKMKCVSEQQLKKAVESGMDYVRISFHDAKEPIYLVFNEKPTNKDISDFLETLFYDNVDHFTIIWRDEIQKEEN